MSLEKDFDYILYIDEAGDDGLKRVRPLDDGGSSEWLIIAGVLIRASREAEVKDWVRDIRNGLPGRVTRDFHFRRLNPAKKLHVCQAMADLSARYFVVCSNKKNMRGYRNPLAEKIPAKNWFYCWMTRLLLERATDYVHWHSLQHHGEPRKIRIEYSNRGGFSYAQMGAYYQWIRYQGTNTYLNIGRIHWPSIDYDLLKVYTHNERAGLQLADVVASAFFKACDRFSTGACDPTFAKLLGPRMARPRDTKLESVSGYGVKLMPSLKKSELLPDQEDIFRFYGYPKQWWAPDPSDP
ncbi:MAG: hypothetical protein TEF_00280 [Rhizobiales bacterium NRL2]|jgi:hypothetical protein|nr:MAG: hypothetical protein TEF_00280 [Rhizobiales bacterium NRL2]